MAAGELPVAETYDGGPLDQHRSQADARAYAGTAAERAAKAALVMLARVLARQAAAEAIEQREHEVRPDEP